MHLVVQEAALALSEYDEVKAQTEIKAAEHGNPVTADLHSKDNGDADECNVCMERENELLFKPCRHLSCSKCYWNMKQCRAAPVAEPLPCPWCRELIYSVELIKQRAQELKERKAKTAAKKKADASRKAKAEEAERGRLAGEKAQAEALAKARDQERVRREEAMMKAEAEAKTKREEGERQRREEARSKAVAEAKAKEERYRREQEEVRLKALAEAKAKEERYRREQEELRLKAEAKALEQEMLKRKDEARLKAETEARAKAADEQRLAAEAKQRQDDDMPKANSLSTIHSVCTNLDDTHELIGLSDHAQVAANWRDQAARFREEIERLERSKQEAVACEDYARAAETKVP